MPRVELNQAAPDFELEDFRGERLHLSEVRGRQRVVLVFNRGFL